MNIDMIAKMQTSDNPSAFHLVSKTLRSTKKPLPIWKCDKIDISVKKNCLIKQKRREKIDYDNNLVNKNIQVLFC